MYDVLIISNGIQETEDTMTPAKIVVHTTTGFHYPLVNENDQVFVLGFNTIQCSPKDGLSLVSQGHGKVVCSDKVASLEWVPAVP